MLGVCPSSTVVVFAGALLLHVLHVSREPGLTMVHLSQVHCRAVPGAEEGDGLELFLAVFLFHQACPLNFKCEAIEESEEDEGESLKDLCASPLTLLSSWAAALDTLESVRLALPIRGRRRTGIRPKSSLSGLTLFYASQIQSHPQSTAELPV